MIVIGSVAETVAPDNNTKLRDLVQGFLWPRRDFRMVAGFSPGACSYFVTDVVRAFRTLPGI
jgi:hypothetical protein